MKWDVIKVFCLIYEAAEKYFIFYSIRFSPSRASEGFLNHISYSINPIFISRLQVIFRSSSAIMIFLAEFSFCVYTRTHTEDTNFDSFSNVQGN